MECTPLHRPGSSTGSIEPDQLALMRRLVMVAALNTGDPDTYLGDLPELVWAISWCS